MPFLLKNMIIILVDKLILLEFKLTADISYEESLYLAL